jgi:hypothetical protein
MKKFNTIRLAGFILVSMLLLSCGMQKRQHMSGYYISWKKNKADHHSRETKKAEKEELSQTQPKVENEIKSENAATEPSGVSASTSKDLVVASPKSARPLIGKPEVQDQKVTHKKPSYKFKDKLPKLKETGSYNGFAIASMVLGILALITFYGAFVFGVLAIVFGAIALKRLRDNPGQKGRGMAIAGLICGIVALVAMLIVFSVAASAFAFA